MIYYLGSRFNNIEDYEVFELKTGKCVNIRGESRYV